MKYIFGIILIITSAIAAAESLELRSYTLPNHGVFDLKVPISWKGNVSQPPRELPATIKYSSETAAKFTVLITPIWLETADTKPPTKEQLFTNVRQSANAALQRSVEKTIEIQNLKGTSNSGYYFTATDSMPQPGEFKYLNRGVITVDNLIVSFTILTNDGQGKIVEDALAALLTAEHH